MGSSSSSQKGNIYSRTHVPRGSSNINVRTRNPFNPQPEIHKEVRQLPKIDHNDSSRSAAVGSSSQNGHNIYPYLYTHGPRESSNINVTTKTQYLPQAEGRKVVRELPNINRNDLPRPATVGSTSSSQKEHNIYPYLYTNVPRSSNINVTTKSPIKVFNPELKPEIRKEVHQLPKINHNDSFRPAAVSNSFNPNVQATSNILPKRHEMKHEMKDKSLASCMKSSESASKSPTPPSMILTKDDFKAIWFSWKDEFIMFINSDTIDKVESDKQKRGMMLLNRMGPTGQEIHKNFVFDNDQEKYDINVLLQKFDYYCVFGDRRRGDDEEIDKYVNALKVMASKHAAVSIDDIVKQKILSEINKNKFTSTGSRLIPEFSFPSCVQSLTVKEITYIWMIYENVNYTKSEKIENKLVWNCHNCAGTHIINKCPAHGKRCNKCDNENHYGIRCPSQYIANCSNCGEGHFIRDCPAYMNECSKCHRWNHFFWKCSMREVLNCNFCGQRHIASKAACCATNSICTKCYERGHFAFKCKRR